MWAGTELPCVVLQSPLYQTTHTLFGPLATQSVPGCQHISSGAVVHDIGCNVPRS